MGCPKTTPEAILSTSAAKDADTLMRLSAQPENSCYSRVMRRPGLAQTLDATLCLNAWVPVHARPQSHGHLSDSNEPDLVLLRIKLTAALGKLRHIGQKQAAW